jgi:hypothetical protein
MGHYAKIENGIVVQVNSIDEDFFNNNPDRHTGQWIQTSYNTRDGVHALGGTPLRFNFAGIGMVYDEERDVFYHPQPYSSWTLNETTYRWEAPIPYPTDNKNYVWNDNREEWEEQQ